MVYCPSLRMGKGRACFLMNFSWLLMESMLTPKTFAFLLIVAQPSRRAQAACLVQPGVSSFG